MWSATIPARAAFTPSRIATLGKLRQWTQQTTQEQGEQLPGLGSVLGNIQDYADLTNEYDIKTETLHTMALNVSQRTISQASMENAYEQILQSLGRRLQVRHSFCRVEVQEQGLFSPPPRTPRAEMDDKSFVVAAGLRTGIPMGGHVTHCHKICDDTICGAELDDTQTHALICQLQGSTVHRHNRIRDTIAHILRESGQYFDVGSSNWCWKHQMPLLHHEWTSSLTGHWANCDGRLRQHSDSASLRQRHKTGRGCTFAGDQQIPEVPRFAGHTSSP